MLRRALTLLWLTILLASAVSIPRGKEIDAADVLMHHNDWGRSGANTHETILDVETVKSGRFGRLAVRPVDGDIYAQPLIVGRALVVGRPAPTTLAIVATQHNSVYAFDATDDRPDSAGALVWHTGPDVIGPSVPSPELSQLIAGSPHCDNITPEIGITSTPAIALDASDPRTGTIFTVAKTRRARRDYQYTLFALRLSDGRALSTGTPIEGDAPGNGKGASGPHGNRRIRFDPTIHLNRPALIVRDHMLFVAFGSHCDKRNYHGWLFAYDVSTPEAPRLVDIFCTTPNGRGRRAGAGAIWMSGQGPSVSSDGHLFFSTGDGGYDGGTDFGNTVLRVALDAGRFRVIDWFTPRHHEHLTRRDADLGSTGVALLEDHGVLAAASKEGRLYLIDMHDMGRLAKPPLYSLQVTNAPFPRTDDPGTFWNIHGAPVVWRGPDATFVYVWGEEDRLRQYRLEKHEDRWRLQPIAVSAEFTPYPNPPIGRFEEDRRGRDGVWMPGAVLSISSNGDRPGTGILWANMGRDGNAVHMTVPGLLRAYDASDVSRLLWESIGEADHDAGMFAKFTPPTIAGGRVFLATFQGDQPAALVVYGLRKNPLTREAPGAESGRHAGREDWIR